MKTIQQKPSERTRRLAWLALWPMLSVAISGCAIVPILPSGQTYGKVITRQQVEFIVPGQTTRTEMISHLGDQFRDSPRMPVLAYAWEKSTIGWGWPAENPPPLFENFFKQHERNGGSHWRAFFVAFDNDEKVSRTKFVHLSSGKSLDEQLEDWAQRRGAAPTPACLK
jgi:hypothetical protein